MICYFELGHYAAEAAKKIFFFFAKAEDAVDQSNQMVQEISFRLQEL